jgi:phosphoribosylaminoimidazole-succinocarboxamide synthase
MKGLTYTGKAKRVTNIGDNSVILEFLDQVTAFQGREKVELERKGIINCEISSILFNILEGDCVKTHFQSSEGNTMTAMQLDMIPLEVVVRNKAAGSILKGAPIERGLEFRHNVTRETIPLVEFHYKDDSLDDPFITEARIQQTNILRNSVQNLQSMSGISRRINNIFKPLFRSIGLDLIDFKLEFGYPTEIFHEKQLDGLIYLGDELSPDNMRLWDIETGESFDKDIFRNGHPEQLIDAYEIILKKLKKL